MVFHDLSSSKEPKLSDLKGATVGDRALSFFIDILLLSPVFQLILAPFSKKIELLSISAPDSLELSALLFVAVALVATLIVAFQTLCWSLWGATPGKYFLKLQVVGEQNPNRRGMPWAQALLRSVIWCIEFILLGIPFLEVLSHRRRRPLHDRASETFVVTLKERGDHGPHPVETHFIRQAMLILALIIASWTFFAIGRVYHLAMEGAFKKDDLIDENHLCSRVSEETTNRVDEALALFLVGEVADDCVEKESEFVLWSPGSEKKSWAYLARGIISQDKTKQSTEYLKKVCELDQGEACRIANKILDEKPEKNAEVESAWMSLTAKVLQLESLERQGYSQDLIQRVNGFPSENFKGALIGYLMRAFWSNHDLEKARGIFEAENLTLDLDSKRSLAAWMCLQEIDLSCERSAGSRSCDVVLTTPASGQFEVAWAQVKLRDCRRTTEPSIDHFQEIISKRPDFKLLLEATVRETGWAADQRAAQLERIAKSSRGLMQSFATREWIGQVHSEKQLRSVFTLLEGQKNHDWKWQANVLKAFERAYSLKEFELGFELSQLVRSALFVQWNMDQHLVVTAFKADQKKWAYDFWKNQMSVPSERMPAASTPSEDWKEIETSFKKMRSPQ